MTRAINFGAGPATLPLEILQQVQEELLDWNGTGVSVMEISHRSPEFEAMMVQAKQDLCDILSIPDNYETLFLTAPARSQFAMVPMNILRGRDSADYFDTGLWSHIAITEAKRYCNVNFVASTREQSYTSIPASTTWHFDPEAAYVHYTANESINGVEFQEIPDTGDVPLVVDMTSNILSRPFDVSRFGIIYAGAQKNMGPAGMTLVIIRKDLLGETMPKTPLIYDYAYAAKTKSLYYTPASIAYYMAGLTFSWIKNNGGLTAMFTHNQKKAAHLYACIDASDFYTNNVEPACRSLMNIPFLLADPALDPVFIDAAKDAGIVAIKGHRLVGGMRASLYNAMTEQGVLTLTDFMQEFTRRYG